MKRMLPHGPPADERLLLTVPEAARTLGIGTTLAYEMVGRGREALPLTMQPRHDPAGASVAEGKP